MEGYFCTVKLETYTSSCKSIKNLKLVNLEEYLCIFPGHNKLIHIFLKSGAFNIQTSCDVVPPFFVYGK